MTSFLEVETADLVDAARTMCLQVAEPVDRAVGGLASALEGLGAMAGGDPGAREWAASYDRAAHTALRAGVDVTNACYRIATMFGRSARNYEAADSASAARTRQAAATAVQRLPYDGELLMSVALPSAAGGSGGGPAGWGLVQSAVGYVWPDGHQDRLHAAAAAWSHSASVLDDHAFAASLPALDFLRDRLPEGDDIVTVCQAMRGHLTELADVHRSLGDTCTELAHHIDTAHSAIISELEWMLGESALLQGLGAAISAITAGGAEAPTQGIEAGRIAKAVTAIKGFIHTFLTAVRALTARVGQIVDRASAVASRVRSILQDSLHIAQVRTVGRFNVAYRSQLLALERLRQRTRAAKRLAIRDFIPPPSAVDRHGFLRAGRYFVTRGGMAPHVGGKIGLALKSKFLRGVDAEQAVLDAAAYADKYKLWRGTKAVVRIENGPVGVVGRTGRTTEWITITRRKTGALHGWPSEGPHA